MHLHWDGAELAATELVLLGHARHCISVAPPVPARYLPTPQDLHMLKCGVSWYVPGAHAVHRPVLASPNDPALQTQLVFKALPSGEVDSGVHASQAPTRNEPVTALYVPAWHSVQFAEPGPVLYVPARHAAHVPPSRPEKPMLHVQLLCTPLRAGEWAFAGQPVHSRSPRAENFPAAHGRQFATSSEALVGEYRPTPHGEHSSCPTRGL